MTGEQVTTVQELEALSSATVIRDGNGVIYERVYDEEWSSPGDACVWDDEIVALPADRDRLAAQVEAVREVTAKANVSAYRNAVRAILEES